MVSGPDPSRAPRWPHAIDGIVDGGVVAGALWTLWYEAALLWQFDLRPSGWVFVLVTVLCVAGGARSALRSTGPDGATGGSTAPVEVDGVRDPGSPGPSVLRLALLVLGLALLVVTVMNRVATGPVLLAVVVIAVIVVVTWPILGRRLPAEAEAEAVDAPAAAPGQRSHLVAAAVSVGIGLFSLFVFKTDADDVYYVNRAAWVAEHGTAALRDTMFGPKIFPNSFGGGLPTPSIEALQGVLASMLGVEAGTIAYLLYAPILAAAFVWVTWRLVRAWSPRRHLLVLLVALLFTLASGASIIGNYSIGRIWQGKVTAYAVLIPLVWTYLTRAAERASSTRIWLLLASGIAFVGLTTSSALLMPVIVAAALLAALVLRSRGLLLGALAFAVGPLVNGAVQILGASDIGSQDNGVTTTDQIFAIAFGAGTAMATLAVIALAITPGIMRRPAAAVAGAAAIATMAAFLPGVVGLVDTATGAGPVVWRIAIVAPTWVFVGLLVAVPDSITFERLAVVRNRPVAGAAAGLLAVAVALVTILGGHWIWSAQVGAQLVSDPRWKVDAGALSDVRAAQALNVPPGLWLMPPVQMQNLAIATTREHAVVPRVFYLDTLDAPERTVADRRALYALVAGRGTPKPSVRTVRGALRRLDVSLACVSDTAGRARRILSSAVDAPLVAVGSMRCHLR